MTLRWYHGTRSIHEVTLQEFLDGPVFRKAPVTMGVIPVALPAGTQARPFDVPGYSLRVGPTWEAVTWDEDPMPVAIYRRNYELRVAHAHQGLGIGAHLMVWRGENRGHRDYPVSRSLAGLRCARRAHELAVRRALARGDHVPPAVLADYGE